MKTGMNTHSYDGQLLASRLHGLDAIQKLDLETKREYGLALIAIMERSPVAMHFLKQIVSDIGTAANFDPTNHLVADDLIGLCWLYRDNPDFVSMLEGQLIDMATGFCPQGRTHRLYQIILAFQS